MSDLSPGDPMPEKRAELAPADVEKLPEVLDFLSDHCDFELDGDVDAAQGLDRIADFANPKGFGYALDGEIAAWIQSRGMQEKVELLGWVDAEGRSALLEWGDVFCLPSYAEGMPNSLVEAMAASNPVIAHDNAYNRWVAQDAALAAAAGGGPRAMERHTSRGKLARFR